MKSIAIGLAVILLMACIQWRLVELRKQSHPPIATVESLCGEVAGEAERFKGEVERLERELAEAKRARVAAKQDALASKQALIAEKLQRIEALQRVNKLQLDLVAALNRIRQLSNGSEHGTTVQMREVPYEKETP